MEEDSPTQWYRRPWSSADRAAWQAPDIDKLNLKEVRFPIAHCAASDQPHGGRYPRKFRADCKRRQAGAGPRGGPRSHAGVGPDGVSPSRPADEPGIYPSEWPGAQPHGGGPGGLSDRKSTRLNSSHLVISYAVF